MKFYKVLWSHAKQYVFWMLFLMSHRVIFLLFNYRKTSEFSLWEILQSFYYGYKLDQSIASYGLMIPLFLIVFSSVFKTTVLHKINKYYTYAFVTVLSILIVSELNLYAEWSQKLSYKAISYMARPAEVFHTASGYMLIFGFGFAFLLSFGFIKLYDRYFYVQERVEKPNYIVSVLYLGIVGMLLAAGARGGFQPIPISQSQSFYSEHTYLNTTAVNSVWNLAHSIEKNAKYGSANPFMFHDLDEAKKRVHSLYSIEKDTTVKIFDNEKPNVVIIMLESWAGSMIHSLGGRADIAPNFEKLIDEGIFFDNFYATATLSHQGIVAIYGGWPTTPHVDIINQIEKVHQLPKLTKSFENQGYGTSFLFGGQLIYGNIKGYILNSGFDQITEGEDFENSYDQGRLGVHDEGLYTKLLEQQNSYKEPFLSGAFTASTHSPYDHPKMAKEIPGGGEHHAFINSVHYADSCLYNYFEKAKKQDWYDNTVFLLLADHSHPTPVDFGSTYFPEYRKIPFLILGEPLKKKYRGTKNHRLMTQSDLVATILGQLDMPYDQFEWSNNAYNPYVPEYVYYGFDDGLGWLTPGNSFVYQSWEKNTPNKGRIYQHFDDPEKEDSIRVLGESYLQVLYQTYLDY